MNIREVISKHNLFPVVPIVQYKKFPICPWSDESYWIYDKKDCEIKTHKWINKDSQEKTGQITGFSLITGKKSNIIVIDLDIGHSDGVNGSKNFNELIKYLSDDDKNIIKSTFTVETPRGGYHLYFKYVEGIPGKADYFKEIDKHGIDVRSDGNCVPIPYTKFQFKTDNNSYKLAEYKLKDDTSIKEMPQSLINIFKQHLEEISKKVPNKTLKDKNSHTYSKYFKPLSEGEGRDNALISYLGLMIKENPNMRKKDILLQDVQMKSSFKHSHTILRFAKMLQDMGNIILIGVVTAVLPQ